MVPHLPQRLRPVEWMGTTREDLRGMPEVVQDAFGYGLHQAQLAKHHPAARRLRGAFGGLVELVQDFDRSTYRLIYTAKLEGVVYVLHVFKKSPRTGSRRPAATLP